MCNGICKACPLALTDESEKVQNYGCLPSAYEIARMKLDHNKNWHCHEDQDKLCVGYLQWAKEKGWDYKDGGSANLTTWEQGMYQPIKAD